MDQATTRNTIRAADQLARVLAALGADRMFCVPGESYLSFLDALHDQTAIDTVVCRHEGGAAMMAVADAKLTGRPGLVAVSRGPGATNASIGLHLADQDAVPVVCLIGQVARFERGRGAFQEVDYTQMFGGIAKGVWEVTEGSKLAETVVRAWALAQSGTPGPVVIALPEDMLSDLVEDGLPAPMAVPRAGVAPDDLARASDMLAQAERPLIIAGSGLNHPAGRAALANLAQTHGVPVALTFKHQEIFDNGSPLYAGHLGFKSPAPLVKALGQADLIMAIGTRMGDTPSQGYQLPRAPRPDQPFIHVWPDADVLGRVFETDLPVSCDPALFCDALAGQSGKPASDRADWAAQVNGVARKLASVTPQDQEDGLDFGSVVMELAKQAPHDSIVITDSGNFSGWVHLYWPWDGSQLAVGAAGGAMGLGMPGAVAAALRHPDKTVLGFAGDGGVLMTGNEIATAMAKGAKPKIVVSDNRTYGTIRLHQERDHPNRVSGTDLVNPDFAAWGEAFGLKGFSVEKGDDVAAVVADFLSHDGPAILSARTSAQAISAHITIAGLHARMAKA